MKNTETKKPGDVLATADFRITGTGHMGENVDETVHAELYVSGAFQYGNQTAMSFEWSARKGRDRIETFDTRYENVWEGNFAEFAQQVLEDRLIDTVKVERYYADVPPKAQRIYLVMFDTQRGGMVTYYHYYTEAKSQKAAITNARAAWETVNSYRKGHAPHQFHCEAHRVDRLPEDTKLGSFFSVNWRPVTWGNFKGR